MNYQEQRASDLAYTRLIAAELRLRFFLARLRFATGQRS